MPASSGTGYCQKLTDAEWDAVLATHLGGTFRTTRAVVPTVRASRYGRIVGVTSYTGLHRFAAPAEMAAAVAFLAWRRPAT